MNNLVNLYEGGNAIPASNPVKREDVPGVVNHAKSLIPPEIAKGIQADIGSAGYKIQSGDIDLFVEAQDVVDFFNTSDSKDPVKDAKQLFKQFFEKQGIQSVVKGRNVHVGIPYTTQDGKKGLAQVDIMVIHDAKIVAPWHQHGLRGMYDEPDFKGNELFILLNSLAKFKNLKFDAFGGQLMNRDTNEVVGRSRREVAKILLNPKARESDLNSVKSILNALENDPDREGKLTLARQDAAKGLLRLPETARIGTAAWFRQLTDRIQ